MSAREGGELRARSLRWNTAQGRPCKGHLERFNRADVPGERLVVRAASAACKRYLTPQQGSTISPGAGATSPADHENRGGLGVQPLPELHYEECPPPPNRIKRACATSMRATDRVQPGTRARAVDRLRGRGRIGLPRCLVGKGELDEAGGGHAAASDNTRWPPPRAARAPVKHGA